MMRFDRACPCPIRDCTTVASNGVMCGRHFRLIPNELTIALMDTCEPNNPVRPQAHIDIIHKCAAVVQATLDKMPPAPPESPYLLTPFGRS